MKCSLSEKLQKFKSHCRTHTGTHNSPTSADCLAARAINNSTEEWMAAVRAVGMMDEAIKFGGLSVRTIQGRALTRWIWPQIWFILTMRCRDEIQQQQRSSSVTSTGHHTAHSSTPPLKHISLYCRAETLQFSEVKSLIYKWTNVIIFWLHCQLHNELCVSVIYIS